MGPKLQNVVDLYVHGLRDGHLAAALDKYVAVDLIEHSPGIGDGRDGLLEAYEPLVARHYRRGVHPVRGFEDGTLVFLHTFTTYGWREVEHVTLDIFDTDGDDHITEHWGVTTPLRSRTAGGCSQIDGPRWVTDTHLTQTNKSLVEAYVRRCLIDGGDTSDYVSAWVDHDPDAEPGSARHSSLNYRQLQQLAGAGNFVATACRYTAPDHAVRTVADLYRVEGGRIVERWNAVEH